MNYLFRLALNRKYFLPRFNTCSRTIVTRDKLLEPIYFYNFFEKSLQNFKASDIPSKSLKLSTEPILPETTSILDAVQFMQNKKIDHFFVLNERRIIKGLITHSEIASIFLKNALKDIEKMTLNEAPLMHPIVVLPEMKGPVLIKILCNGRNYPFCVSICKYFKMMNKITDDSMIDLANNVFLQKITALDFTKIMLQNLNDQTWYNMNKTVNDAISLKKRGKNNMMIKHIYLKGNDSVIYALKLMRHFNSDFAEIIENDSTVGVFNSRSFCRNLRFKKGAPLNSYLVNEHKICVKKVLKKSMPLKDCFEFFVENNLNEVLASINGGTKIEDEVCVLTINDCLGALVRKKCLLIYNKN